MIITNTYTLLQWLTFFMIYCFFGWIFESVYCSIKAHKWINRGFCRGPWIPIYGSGALIMLFVTTPYQDNIILVYISGLIGASLLELVTGYVMFHLFKVRWWDYSQNPLNLGGYICLGTSIAWGFLSIALTEFLHPMVLHLTQSWSRSFTIAIDSLFYVLFTTDSIISFNAAWDIRNKILALSRIKAEMAELLANIDDLTDDAKAMLLAHANEIRSLMHERAGETLDYLQDKTEATLDRLQSSKETMIDRASDAFENAQNRAGNVLENAQNRASDALENAQNRAANMLDSLQNKSGSLSGSYKRDALESGYAYRPLKIDENLRKRLSALQSSRVSITHHLSSWSQSMLRNNPSACSDVEGFADMKAALRKRSADFKTRIEDIAEDFLKEIEERNRGAR